MRQLRCPELMVCPAGVLLHAPGTLERNLGKPARKNLLPMQPGDVPATYADLSELVSDTGYEPQTSIEEGIGKFVDWYRSYYQV